MATRRSAAMSMDEAASATQRPGKVAAFLPVDNRGNPVEMEQGGEDWQMPVAPGGALMAPHPDDETEDETEQSPTDRIMLMMRGINDGDRAYMNCSRIDPGNQVIFCAKYSAADFEAGGLELIRDQWGPGQYQLILYGTKHRPDGSEHFGIRDRTTVRLAAPLLTAPKSNGQSDLAQMLGQLAESNRQLIEAVSKRPEPVDQMTQMTAMLGMMKMMREAMGMDQAPKPTNSIKEIIESIQAITEVKDLINPPAVPETPMGMVTQMLPMITQAMQARQQQPQPAANPAPVLRPVAAAPAMAPVSMPVQPVLAAPKEGEEVNPVAMLALRGHLMSLVQMAKDGAEVQAGADLVYEHIPDDFIALMAQPNWFDMLKMIVSGDIEPQRDWLTKARDTALAMFDQPDDAGPADDVIEATPGKS